MSGGSWMEESSTCLLGAVAGDISGSVYEFAAPKSSDFTLFTPSSQITDNSILTLVVADAILQKCSCRDCIQDYARAYPGKGYGGFFRRWIQADDPQPYNSYGNGSAMRVSALGWAFNMVEDVLREAEASAAVTHSHPESIKGAQPVALAVFFARQRVARDAVRKEITGRFGYDLSPTLEDIRPGYHFDETCPGTVPQAITASLESEDFEDAIRKATSLGGDADTLAAIFVSIAEAYFGGVPASLVVEVQKRLPPELWMLVERFRQKYLYPDVHIHSLVIE